MISAILLTLAMTCPETIIDNRTNEWTPYDMQTLAHAKVRCGEIYPDSPCVKKFIKKDESTYNVICGI